MLKIPKPKLVLIAIGAIAIVLFIACTPNWQLANQRWSLTEFGEAGSMEPVARRARITFDSDFHSFAGSDGCNSIRGNYLAIAGRIVVLGMSSTEKACLSPPNTMHQTSVVKRVLKGRPTFSVDGDKLTITSSDGTLVYGR